MRDLVLILTARCNLACSYCYEAGRSARGDMPWDVARTALELLLQAPASPALLAFTGGEPFLAEALFRRCVGHARGRVPSSAALRILASTNGTLLDDDLVRFLARNDVELQVSYDGKGQELRAGGTGPEVAASIRRLADVEPDWFRRRVRVALTLTPRTLPLLAASVETVLRLGIRDIAVDAVTAADWPPGPILEAELDRELSRIVASCNDLVPGWTEPPVALLREPPPRSLPAEDDAWCRAGAPESVAVDPSGTVWGCPLAPSSMQRLTGAGQGISDALLVGRLRDPGLSTRLAELPSRARSARALTHRRSKRSALGDCDTCPHLLSCAPCALAAARAPGGPDPDFVPAITCALTRAAARARAKLPRPYPALLRDLEKLSDRLFLPGTGPSSGIRPPPGASA